MKPLLYEISLSYSAEEVYALFATEANSVFLDSGMDSQGMGRYSFIGRDPFLVVSSKGTRVSLQDAQGTRVQEGSPFEILRGLLATYHTEKVLGFPALTGGVMGYFGYDMGGLLENLPNRSQDIYQIPDCYIGFYDTVLIFDHYEEKVYIASTGFPELDGEKQINRAQERIQELRELLKKTCHLPAPEGSVATTPYTGDFTKEAYCEIVQKAIDYIGAGDIFQVNLSQRFSASLTVPPFALYRYLRQSNPAPFASYLNFGDFVVASASPERYLQLKDQVVETRPIKGTKPRGKDSESDQRLRAELLSSEKDQAELVMIIDLSRNDLGRVCEYGSVQVPDLIRIEEYATVFHLVSTVTGRLQAGKGIVDVIQASFPGGSITGAPKVRAMEIIEECEPIKRGIYTGSIGYLDFNGDADLNIVIRTLLLKDGQAHFQVGGAVTADSVPELEYLETLDKGRALMNALGYQV